MREHVVNGDIARKSEIDSSKAVVTIFKGQVGANVSDPLRVSRCI